MNEIEPLTEWIAEAQQIAVLTGAGISTASGIPDFRSAGEMLPEREWEASVQAMATADLVLVLGTSLEVHPAAALPGYRPWNARLVIINRDPTPMDREAQLVMHADLCETLSTVSGCLTVL